ncbi:Hypothetical protein, putative [Bodo saltans]|uniref:EFHB C-terminal EF-hand domain-containing protein n=1 Tax=Bodo saltans TaxID=75058 RepID=A0A0S4J2B8_BODSA|nr:Hypothetical protein, putative [Bodo saltans]CUG41395.1 Hypothetical protein, putative [Bodo saltans]|eukprot:CUG34060.1 Hypothetical protein, putative [Bodo saltans]
MSRISLLPTEGGAFFARDPAPQLRPAGKIYPPEVGGVRADITQVAVGQNRIPTPTGIKPFRREHAMPLGHSTRHTGTRHDSPRDQDRIYGAKNVKLSSVEDCLKPNSNSDKMGSLAAEHAEQRYLSNRKEPLGRVPDASIPIPDALVRDGFGIPTKKSDSAKVVIYNSADKEAKLLHPPGEQKTRGYDWTSTNIDPSNHRFGAVGHGNPITTKELVSPQGTAHVLPKIVRDFDAVTYPELSKTRNLGFGSRNQGADYTYGKPLKRDELNARQLISGVATLPDVQLDDGTASSVVLSGSASGGAGASSSSNNNNGGYNQLGGTYVKSVTQRKLRSLDKEDGSGKFGGVTRSLGVPSIRTDIPKPDETYRKVTNGVNYGDDVGAKHLLYPNEYIGNGILTKYYGSGKTLEEIQQLCVKLELDLTNRQIEEAFEVASASTGRSTVEAFRDVTKQLGF